MRDNLEEYKRSIFLQKPEVTLINTSVLMKQQFAIINQALKVLHKSHIVCQADGLKDPVA